MYNNGKHNNMQQKTHRAQSVIHPRIRLHAIKHTPLFFIDNAGLFLLFNEL
jgi:hypothetical protein